MITTNCDSTQVPDSLCLEVRIMDQIVNFRFALFGILVFVDCFVFSFKFLLHGVLHSAVTELQPKTEVL